MKDQHFMIGKTINKILVADDKLAINFVCDDGEHVAEVDADCCSYTWVENIETPALGYPAKVFSVEDLMLAEDEWDEHLDDLTQFYGCKISTDKGDIVIDYRNSSNGYYGGSLCWPDDEYRYGGVHGQANSNMKWLEITS
jgi:hypothetical protein